jgi:hypothetical protein
MVMSRPFFVDQENSKLKGWLTMTIDVAKKWTGLKKQGEPWYGSCLVSA